MSFEKEITKIISHSMVRWLKNKKLLTYLGINFLVYIIFLIALNFLTSYFISNLILENGQASPLIIDNLLNFYLNLGLILIPMGILFTIINYCVIREGLNILKEENIKLNLTRFIKFLFIPVFASIFAMLLIYDIKKLLIGIAGFILFVIGIVFTLTNIVIGTIAIGVGLLLLIIYFIFVIINQIKLSLGEVIFVNKEESIFKSLKESHTITKNQVFNMLLIYLVFVIIIMIISYIAMIPSMSFIILNASQATTNEISLMMNLHSDPIYFLLSLPVYFISAYALICQSLIIVGIYTNLIKNKETVK